MTLTSHGKVSAEVLVITTSDAVVGRTVTVTTMAFSVSGVLSLPPLAADVAFAASAVDTFSPCLLRDSLLAVVKGYTTVVDFGHVFTITFAGGTTINAARLIFNIFIAPIPGRRTCSSLTVPINDALKNISYVYVAKVPNNRSVLLFPIPLVTPYAISLSIVFVVLISAASPVGFQNV